MKPHYEDDGVAIHHGDCIDVMRSLPDASVDSVVTDPPYGLGFMGKEWDNLPPGPEFAAEAFRVLKPGGHLLAFGGTRTWHRLAVAVEDAGFEIRDSIAWLYGSGFPKSLSVAKAIEATIETGGSSSRDLRAVEQAGDGAAYQMTGKNNGIMGETVTVDRKVFAPTTEQAKAWEGWGTALKPAFEPVVVARKPLSGTVAANVLAHGTGALNIDACRVSWGAEGDQSAARKAAGYSEAAKKALGRTVASESSTGFAGEVAGTDASAGRFPPNVLLDESQAGELDKQSGVLTSGLMKARTNRAPRPGGTIYGADKRNITSGDTYGDSGGASRFFPTFRYEAKAPGSERPEADGVQHPTVKPLDLMRWLVRLVTPPGGTVLEPFAGSGTTIEAALLEGFSVIGIEREETYLPLIMQRISKPLQQSLFGDMA